MKDIEKLGKADLHIHSTYSDGRDSIEEILYYVENNTSLDVIAICDHNQIAGAKIAQQLAKVKNMRIEVIVGEEITSSEGHIIGLFLKDNIRSGSPAKEVLKNIKSQGGIAVAPHPFFHTKFRSSDLERMDGVGVTTLINLRKYFDAVEVVNASPGMSSENLRAGILNNTILLKAETGSSDAHMLEVIGKSYTLFEGKTASDLKHEILQGQTKAGKRKWSLFGMLRYGFFLLPRGLRIFLYTLFHGGARDKFEIYK